MATTSFARSIASSAAHVPGGPGYPVWARWNDERDHRYSLSLEEEVMLLEPGPWTLAAAGESVLSGLSERLAKHASADTHAAVIELSTDTHSDPAGVVGELAELRRRLSGELEQSGLRAAAAGSHPLSAGSEMGPSSGARPRTLGDSIGVLAPREPTMALHVHVGLPSPEEALRVLNRLRSSAPVMLALSANSPFWQGRDGGFASSRAVVFGALPRTGLPRRFPDYRRYVEALEPLISSEAVPGLSFVWWDVRLLPALGTVEVRVMDAQSTVREVAPILALIQSLARLELEGEPPAEEPAPEVLAENLFLAARDGMAADLIDPVSARLVPVRETLEVLLSECRPHALALGCVEVLEGLRRLAAANGADRQRALARSGAGLERVVASLADRFLAPPWPARLTVRRGGQA